MTYEDPLVDFGVIVALPEEFTALQKAMGGFDDTTYKDARTFYHKRVTARSDPSRTYRVIATFLNNMGQAEATNATRDLLAEWRPQNIILTGLAGALHNKIELGDVIFSDWIYYYEPSKITPEGVEVRPQM